VSADAEPSAVVASWGSFTPDPVDLMELARLRGDALKLAQEVDFDG
jgi:iron(III) transport system substrate-binding protein